MVEAKKRKGSEVAMRVERDGEGQAPPAKGPGDAPSMPDNEWTTWTYEQYYKGVGCRMPVHSAIQSNL